MKAVPRLDAPIVLVHGLFGFDQVKFCGYRLASYFHEIPDFLEESGNRVLIAGLSPTQGIANRAAELKAFLNRESPQEPVHLLAHSMGGLDSRYMISQLDMAERVLSLTTIGTPHRGCTFADWGIRRLERLVKPILDMIDMPCQAFYDLTTSSCRKFNELVTNAPQVRYFSVAGEHPDNGGYTRMRLLYDFVKLTEGPNDGIVSLESASYGEGCEVWSGDHLSLVNWPDPTGPSCDRKEEYAQLVGRLADEGF